MKIYSIRDRMLDYFQIPVVVNRGEDFIAAVARGINGEQKNEIAQAPDHYEIWQIGEVDDQGHITVLRDFKLNCASLVRNGVWHRRATGDPATAGQPDTSQDSARTRISGAGPGPGPFQGPKGPKDLQAPQSGTLAGGSDRLPDGRAQTYPDKDSD